MNLASNRSIVQRLTPGPRMPPTSPPASTSEIAVGLVGGILGPGVSRCKAVILAVGVEDAPHQRAEAQQPEALQPHRRAAEQRPGDAPEHAQRQAALPADALHV